MKIVLNGYRKERICILWESHDHLTSSVGTNAIAGSIRMVNGNSGSLWYSDCRPRN